VTEDLVSLRTIGAHVAVTTPLAWAFLVFTHPANAQDCSAEGLEGGAPAMIRSKKASTSPRMSA
jgi:hypothetical protein